MEKKVTVGNLLSASVIIKALVKNYSRAFSGGGFVCVHCDRSDKSGHKKSCPISLAQEWIERMDAPPPVEIEQPTPRYKVGDKVLWPFANHSDDVCTVVEVLDNSGGQQWYSVLIDHCQKPDNVREMDLKPVEDC